MILIQSANYDLVEVICIETIEKQMIDGDNCVYNITYAPTKTTHTLKHLKQLVPMFLHLYWKTCNKNNTIYTMSLWYLSPFR